MISKGHGARRAPRLGRPFWLLWTAAGVSSLGDGLILVAFPLLAVSLSASPLAVAAVVLVGRSAIFVFALPAGALADRVDRRK
ncbi:MAG: MFS transporter, partial [Acidimicrobiales bacterium]